MNTQLLRVILYFLCSVLVVILALPLLWWVAPPLITLTSFHYILATRTAQLERIVNSNDDVLVLWSFSSRVVGEEQYCTISGFTPFSHSILERNLRIPDNMWECMQDPRSVTTITVTPLWRGLPMRTSQLTVPFNEAVVEAFDE